MTKTFNFKASGIENILMLLDPEDTISITLKVDYDRNGEDESRLYYAISTDNEELQHVFADEDFKEHRYPNT